MKTPNDPTTIASSREIIAGVDAPTTTVQTLSAWILAKDYERIRAERDELRAAAKIVLAGLEKRIRDERVSTPVFTGIAALHDALSKGDTP